MNIKDRQFMSQLLPHIVYTELSSIPVIAFEWRKGLFPTLCILHTVTTGFQSSAE